MNITEQMCCMHRTHVGKHRYKNVLAPCLDKKSFKKKHITIKIVKKNI